LDLVYIELDVFIVGHRRLTYIHLRDEIHSGWKKNSFFLSEISQTLPSQCFVSWNFNRTQCWWCDFVSSRLFWRSFHVATTWL